MTMIDYSAFSNRAPSFSGFRAVFDAPALFLKRRFVAGRVNRELSSLTDRQLDDIGLVRADILRVSETMADHTTS